MRLWRNGVDIATGWWYDGNARSERESAMTNDPRNRPFAQLAATLFGDSKAFNAGKCPTCGGEISEFRNAASRREFGISGLCQECQDSVFGAD